MPTVKSDLVSPLAADAKMYSEVVTCQTMTAPIAGDIIENAAQFKYHYWQVVISGNSGTVSLLPECSLDGDGWAAMTSDGDTIDYSGTDANGIKLITSTRGVRASKVRLKFVSGSATITVKYRGAN